MSERPALLERIVALSIRYRWIVLALVMLSAAIGYTVGTRMGLMRRCATRSMKQMKRILCRKLGL